ncbi:MAG: hypothetical protein ACK4VK_06290 [Aquificaceae bacterium]
MRYIKIVFWVGFVCLFLCNCSAMVSTEGSDVRIGGGVQIQIQHRR